MVDKFVKAIGGIFIDDTGTPGNKPPSRYLHTRRKSWAAVIVPDDVAQELSELVNTLLKLVKQEYGADELHFKDIYGARGAFKGISAEERFEIFEFVAAFFDAFELPTFFQTLSPEYHKDLLKRIRISGRLGSLDFSNHEHLALFFLMSEVRQFILDNKSVFPTPLEGYIDEGILKAPSRMFISTPDILSDGVITFINSQDSPFVQLADFAAFCIGRSQWLYAKGYFTEYDVKFLSTISNRIFTPNLPKVEVKISQVKPGDYEAILEKDRKEKGLGEPPEDELD